MKLIKQKPSFGIITLLQNNNNPIRFLLTWKRLLTKLPRKSMNWVEVKEITNNQHAQSPYTMKIYRVRWDVWYLRINVKNLPIRYGKICSTENQILLDIWVHSDHLCNH